MHRAGRRDAGGAAGATLMRDCRLGSVTRVRLVASAA